MNDSADGYQPIPLPRLSDLVGQNRIRDRLTSAVKTAQSGGTQVPHILFDGPAGLGKRTFAEVLARELGVSMTVVSGAEFRYVHDVVPYLTNIGKDEILFVDGIDRIPSAAAADYLGSAMRDFVIPLTFGEGEKERLLNIGLKKFTLIGASAAPDRINPIIMDQFGIRGHFDHYTHGELSSSFGTRRLISKSRSTMPPFRKLPGGQRERPAARSISPAQSGIAPKRVTRAKSARNLFSAQSKNRDWNSRSHSAVFLKGVIVSEPCI